MSSAPTTFAAVLVAAGSGSRLGGAPKQFRVLGDRPLLRWAAEGLLAAGADPLIVVTRAEDRARAAEVLRGLDVLWADGGARRSDSVRNGLALVPERVEAVVVHDAARPLVGPEHIAPLLAALVDADGVLPALPVADTLKRARDDRVVGTAPRTGLHRAQTPQAFRREVLLAAYARLLADAEPTDDAEVVELAGESVVLVAGDERLMKLTWPEDFTAAERLLGGRWVSLTGFGLDAHRFEPGEAVMLCGVRVPHDRGLQGHSDADVGLHALTDAVLGAAGLGDIGDWFPPSDPRWRGADSRQFLEHAVTLAAERGCRMVHADVTLIGERPRVKPHREAMRAVLAEILSLPLERVSVKATTTEGMGFTGREEGLAAQAVATLEVWRPA